MRWDPIERSPGKEAREPENHRPWLLSLGLAALVLMNACSSILRDPTDEEVARILVGRSTRRDVLDILGLPRKTERVISKDGRPAWAWTYFKGQDTHMEVVDTIVGRLGRPAAIVVFSEDGTVVDVRPFKNGP